MEIWSGFVVFGTLFLLVTSVTYAGSVMLIAGNRSLRNSSNFFLINLYVSDFLLSLAIFVHCVFAANFGSDGIVTVRIVTVTAGVAIGSYCLSSVVVAADRYFRVAKPMRYIIFSTNRRCACIIAGSWLFLTFAVLIWQLATSLKSTAPDPFIENRNLTQNSTIMYFRSYATFTIVFTVPCLLLAACFCVGLVRIARKQAHQIQNEARALGNIRGGSPNDNQAGPASAVGQCAPQPPPVRVPNLKKANAYLRIYLSSFVICWMPYTIVISSFIFGRNANIANIFFQMFSWSIGPIVQVYLGTLCLTFCQVEHRRVLPAICRSCLEKFCCRGA